jgi:hypothetical protein
MIEAKAKLGLKIHYKSPGREIPILVHEAAKEKAHGASGVDLSSNGGKELKCR